MLRWKSSPVAVTMCKLAIWSPSCRNYLPAAVCSANNMELRKLLLKHRRTGIRDLSLLNDESLEIFQLCQVNEPNVSNLRATEMHVLELRQASKMLQPRIRDMSVLQTYP